MQSNEPLNLNRSDQKRLVKIRSLSETILFSSPRRLQTVETNNSATLYVVKPEGRAPRCIPLEKRSTTRITMYPEEGGRPVMKSIEASCIHEQLSVGAAKVHQGAEWHIEKSRMKDCVSQFMLSQQKI